MQTIAAKKTLVHYPEETITEIVDGVEVQKIIPAHDSDALSPSEPFPSNMTSMKFDGENYICYQGDENA